LEEGATSRPGKVFGSGMGKELTSSRQGQADHELAPQADHGFPELDLATVFSHQIVAERKPETRSLLGWLRREERLEDSLAELLGDAVTVVTHRDLRHAVDRAGRDPHPPASIDRVEPIHRPVQPDLPQLLRVPLSPYPDRAQVPAELLSLSASVSDEQLDHLTGDSIDVDQLLLGRAAAREV